MMESIVARCSEPKDSEAGMETDFWRIWNQFQVPNKDQGFQHVFSAFSGMYLLQTVFLVGGESGIEHDMTVHICVTASH